MDVAAFLLALVPIIWLVVMLLCFKWPAWKAAIGSFVLSCLLAFAWWHLPAAQIATASLEGFLMALWPIVLVIIAAVFTYNLCVRTGAMDVIGSMITSISSDRRLLALLVAWCFGGFMEGMAGADRNHTRRLLVACERASQALFIKQMLARPLAREIARTGEPDFCVLAAPGYQCDPAIKGLNSSAAVVINFQERVILVAGTGYSGEIKKSIFSVMNYLLPVEDDVLPMHCSASMDPVTHETAVFFGLSGTGKTTLSANPTRLLIGDDEHGWSDMGIFNIEGGCYAKCEGLDAFHEPEIFNAVRFGAICENVVLDESRKPNYDDVSITHNTRVAYPVEHIPNAWTKGMGTTPSVVLFLTCDAFGVLPPISRLTADAAMYHFVTGFTAKIPGTEVGVTEPTPTFSSLFGEPFMPLDPMVYAKMLGERIADGHTRVYLVNTGWIGGGYGVGHRIELAYTRALVARALGGTIEDSEFVHDDIFNVDIPTTCHGVPDGILVPRQYWQSTARYDEAAHNLAVMFEENFEKKYSHLPESVKAAGPHAQVHAGARHRGRGLLGLRH